MVGVPGVPGGEEARGGPACWKCEADGNRACSGREDGEEAWVLYNLLSDVWPKCVSHIRWVCLEVVVEGGKGVEGPEMEGSCRLQATYINSAKENGPYL